MPIPGQRRIARFWFHLPDAMTRVSRAEDQAGALRLMSAGRRLLSAVMLALVAIGLPATAAGHDGITGVFVEPDLVNPGGVIVVRGDNVSTDDPVRVELVAGVTRIELATAVTDGEGHFTVGASLPVDLAAGRYAIEVNGASGVRMTDYVQVDGAAIFDGQEGAPVGRDEGLPTLPPDVGEAAPGAPGPTADAASDTDLVPLAALLAAIGGLMLFVRWTRRPSTSRAESADLP